MPGFNENPNVPSINEQKVMRAVNAFMNKRDYDATFSGDEIGSEEATREHNEAVADLSHDEKSAYEAKLSEELEREANFHTKLDEVSREREHGQQNEKQ